MNNAPLPVMPLTQAPSPQQRLLRLVAGLLVFEIVSGLLPWLLPFSISMQFMILWHTAFGLVFVLPFIWSQWTHFFIGWAKPDKFLKWFGVASCVVVSVATISGLVLTWQSVFGTRIHYVWHYVHLVSGIVCVPVALVHAMPLARKIPNLWRKFKSPNPPLPWRRELYLVPVVCVVVTLAGVLIYEPVNYLDYPLPADYEFAYGDNPFAPSMANTEDKQPVAPVALNNSKSCGAARCHVQIYDEWAAGAHRWSATDQLFQAVQGIMLKEEGAHATRYCAGCHDPVSLLSGFKDAGRGLSAPGFEEGASCLVCHGIRAVDIQGNANYIWHAPDRYLFENKEGPTAAFLSEFLIRAYPDQHLADFPMELMRKPELCGACHKQFIDKEVNKFGWVQLQNQYDEWGESHWNVEGDVQKTLTCQRCHMSLVESEDPGHGDADDPVRGMDGKHRNHRILAANQFMPKALEIEGADEHIALVEKWLQGKYEVPEISHLWPDGPVVPVEIVAPEQVRPGEMVTVRVNVTNKKVGHGFPTGPLDLIESWIEFVAKDANGKVLFHSGTLNEDLHVEQGSTVFKAEGVDQYNKLIDRHNLWDMIGARYKRSIYPGYTDTVEYEFRVPRNARGEIHLSSRLRYRKVNQNFIDTVLGKGAFTTPITDMSHDSETMKIVSGRSAAGPAGD